MPKRLVNLAPDVLLDGNSGGTGHDADELAAGLILVSTGIPGAPWALTPLPVAMFPIIEDEGTPIPGAPHTIYNFVGVGVMAMDAGGGVVDIVIPGGGAALVLYDENPVTPTAPSATGDNAIAIGSGADANGNQSYALGADAIVNNVNGIAIGNGATVSGDNAIAIGLDTNPLGLDDICIGNEAQTSGSGVGAAVAIGQFASVDGEQAIGIGANATVPGDDSVGIGSGVGANGASSVAIGPGANAGAANSVAIGHDVANATADTFEGGTSATNKFSLSATGVLNAPTDLTAKGVSYRPSLVFQADQFENPNNADWAVNSLAPVQAGPTNAALTVRAFDDTTPEGVGFSAPIPAGATSMVFKFKSRAAAAPGAPTTVTPRLYRRTIPDNLAVTAWSALLAMTAIDIPANAFYQYDSQTITLAALGLTAGNQAQFEITRAPGGLVGDWLLLSLEISFT